MSQQRALVAKMANGLSWRRVWAGGRGKFSSPSALLCGGPICSAACSAGLPSSRKMRSYWRELSGGLRG